MQPKPRAVYKGDSFRNLIRQYSFERMAIDPQYRRAVRQAKAAKKAKKHEEVNTNPAPVLADVDAGVQRPASQ